MSQGGVGVGTMSHKRGRYESGWSRCGKEKGRVHVKSVWIITELSGTADENNLSTQNEEIEEEGCQLEHPQEDKEEELLQVEEELLSPLPIPGPSTQLTHLLNSPTLESECSSSTLVYKSTSQRLARCLGEHLETILEETFQERGTPESE